MARPPKNRTSKARRPSALSATEFHALLVLAAGDLYGYAILQAIEKESGGAVSPEIGSLYRVLGRLMSRGWVAEAPPPANEPSGHRGQPRRYYRLTARGHEALRSEARRLQQAVEIARDRELLVEPSSS